MWKHHVHCSVDYCIVNYYFTYNFRFGFVKVLMPFKIVYQKFYLEFHTFFVVFKPHNFKSNRNVIQPSRKDKVDEPVRCLDVPQVLL